MLPDVVVPSTVQSVTPVGAARTRLLALRDSTTTSRSPAAVAAGVVTFGVVVLPGVTAPPTYETVLASGAATTSWRDDASSVACWSSVTTSVMVYVPGTA